ncbi:PREDICTED: dihydrofolate reductase [Theobroma cacao]|uniref:Dihydrofolate reductase n=1 Tax=Theobroma cacao TaxID=3641 RepID=A0AB32WTL2_THECC|nr:PREDICTED: dihydrofolate reductase [Theobroma cacao]
MGSEAEIARKPRFLCLHGFRTSGAILKKQIETKWPQSVLEKIDLVYPDAPFPAQGKSDVEGIFDPPYYEWFQFNKEFTSYTNFEECLAYMEDIMIRQGPFDGLLGFSQGAILSCGLPGLQAKGVALTEVPKIKYLIIIGGAKFKSESVAEKAYSSPIQCPSLHFLGETDFLKPYGLELLESCVDPVVIHHPKGHTIPRFDEKGLESVMSFLERIQRMLPEKQEKEIYCTATEDALGA